MSWPLGGVKVASGSQFWILLIASYHMGPAVVEPCATSVKTPPIVCEFRVIQWPRLLAPAIIDAVARLGVYPMNHTDMLLSLVPVLAADSWLRIRLAPKPVGDITPRSTS